MPYFDFEAKTLLRYLVGEPKIYFCSHMSMLQSQGFVDIFLLVEFEFGSCPSSIHRSNNMLLHEHLEPC